MFEAKGKINDQNNCFLNIVFTVCAQVNNSIYKG